MTAESAGLLLYRVRASGPEVLLVHPGGPFWKNRDEGAWSIPKGEIEPGETAIDVARREFEEELGRPAPESEFMPLGSVRQAGGKVCTRGPRRATSTRTRCRASPSRSSGRLVQAGSRPSPRPTGPSGSTWTWRAERSIRRRARSSNAWRSKRPTVDFRSGLRAAVDTAALG